MRFGLVPAPLALLIPLATPASAAERLVSVVDFEFQPRTVQVDPGDTVTWTFQDEGHTTTADRGQAEAWDSGPAVSPAGARFSRAGPRSRSASAWSSRSGSRSG